MSSIRHDGLIVFKYSNMGSKSEGLRPYLYKGLGQFMAVWKEDDYTLSGDGLLPYDGMSVVITGYEGDADIFVIETIENALEVLLREIETNEGDEDNESVPEQETVVIPEQEHEEDNGEGELLAN